MMLDREKARAALLEVIDGEWRGDETDGELADHLLAAIRSCLAGDAPADTENFEIGMVTGGHEVTITVTYPRGHAMFGLYALHGANEPERMTSVMAILKDDPSVAARIAELGLAIDDEDDE